MNNNTNTSSFVRAFCYYSNDCLIKKLLITKATVDKQTKEVFYELIETIDIDGTVQAMEFCLERKITTMDFFSLNTTMAEMIKINKRCLYTVNRVNHDTGVATSETRYFQIQQQSASSLERNINYFVAIKAGLAKKEEIKPKKSRTKKATA